VWVISLCVVVAAAGHTDLTRERRDPMGLIRICGHFAIMEDRGLSERNLCGSRVTTCKVHSFLCSLTAVRV